jgi:precorrin-6y C5,15-methyltransferase (decarboxylating) CbiE subunit
MGLTPCLVVGCGPGAPELVTPQARQAAAQAQLLAGTARLLSLFPESPAGHLVYDGGLAPFLQGLAPHLGREAVVVLVSGDPGLASLAGTLARHFPEVPFRRLPGLSSVQLAFAEAGLDWIDARILRAHGTLPDWDPSWTGHAGPFALLAGAPGAAGFAADLARRLGRGHLWRCQRLGLPGQSVRRLTPEQLSGEGCDPLSVIIVEGVQP